MSLNEFPHRRYNPLTGEWILVSPHRTQRPWQGRVEEAAPPAMPAYAPDCYLCPGNSRSGGLRNPAYTDTFVFANDFPALLPENPIPSESASDRLLKAEPETGVCRVICYSPRHDLSMADLGRPAVEKVVDAWRAEYASLGARPDINHVQIFENRGALMGCSNPHPHGQIWANRTVPMIPAREGENQAAYLNEHGQCLLCAYLQTELARTERLVALNDSFAALTPFWAVWPFEVMILPLAHQDDISRLTTRQRADLADLLVRLAVKYDNLFQTHFPYSMGIHQAPTDGLEHPEWHFHFHFYPPLLRSAAIRKFMVGYELLAAPQRDVTPETSAELLRNQPEILYRRREEKP